MDESLNPLLAWMKTTDLIELAYQKGGRGVELRLADTEPVVLPEAALVPVGAPAVGVFRASEPGRPPLNEGAALKPGDSLGYVESRGRRVPVQSPAHGFLSKILAEDGRPVQYGQPLFLVEPR